jgi:hypothetical protein
MFEDDEPVQNVAATAAMCFVAARENGTIFD